MVGMQYDCLANPLGVVRSTFDRALATGSDPASLNARDFGAGEVFRHFIFDNGGLDQIPILNSKTIRWIQPNTLVRFQGMIQDMFGNEFYVGAYKHDSRWRTNKFMDVSQFPIVSPSDTHVWERRLLYCVPVPGRNSWTESTSSSPRHKQEHTSSEYREKRHRSDDHDAVDGMDIHELDETLISPNVKKMRDGEVASQSGQVSEFDKCSASAATSLSKCQTACCLVKVYDTPETDLKLNDVFEFIGVYTFDPELLIGKDDTDGFCEDVTVHLPPSQVPRLHCLVHRKLGFSDFASRSSITEPRQKYMGEIRQSLLNYFATVLGDDLLAAHFMLLHLLSRVHTRLDSAALGKLSLNLTSLGKESASVFSSRLKHVLQSLLPFTSSMPLTVDYLNSALMGPRKEYETNRLVTGALQLPEGSHVIVDETQLECGSLNNVGAENARLVKLLAEYQKVDYDFTYYKMAMSADVQLLILSQGKSNMMPADVVLPFRPSSAGPIEPADAEALAAWRWYLATARLLPHSIEPQVEKVLEDDMVAARQEDRSIGSQDFSRWLTLGRLVSMSFGESSLSLDHWRMVKQLERQRLDRVRR